MTESDSEEPASTAYVVIRSHINTDEAALSLIGEGEWRTRADLEREDYIEILTPSGVVRASPTPRLEQSAAGDVAQVYELPPED